MFQARPPAGLRTVLIGTFSVDWIFFILMYFLFMFIVKSCNTWQCHLFALNSSLSTTMQTFSWKFLCDMWENGFGSLAADFYYMYIVHLSFKLSVIMMMVIIIIIITSLCGRDGRTICGPQRVRKVNVCHCNSLGGATWCSVIMITGRTDRQTDGQTECDA